MSFQPFEKHRIPAAEQRSPYNQNDPKRRSGKQVGRDDIALRAEHQHGRPSQRRCPRENCRSFLVTPELGLRALDHRWSVPFDSIKKQSAQQNSQRPVSFSKWSFAGSQRPGRRENITRTRWCQLRARATQNWHAGPAFDCGLIDSDRRSGLPAPASQPTTTAAAP